MTPLEINNLNEKMLDENSYRDKDSRIMTKVSMLKDKNDYDIYLIICTLCNYNIPEKPELIKMRMDYYNIIKESDVDYSHTEDEYIIDKSKLKTTCKNTGNINKYGLYEYEINLNNNNLVSSLWGYKASDCLKFVDSKTYDDKLIVSIRKEQFDNFIKALDELMIGYDLADLKEGMFHDNNSNNKLVDITKLSLPFTPYDYQLEDANKIVAMKRALLAHDMGCGKTFISILVGCSIFNKEDVIYRTLDNLEYNDIVITDKGPLPIGKIVEENIDCKVQVTKNGKTKFVNILDRSCTTE